MLVREMPRYLRCAYLDNEALLAGRWQAALDAAVSAPRRRRLRGPTAPKRLRI